MQDGDDYLGEDIGYPNREAQYRGYRFKLRLLFVAGVLAVVFGLGESGENVIAAFPTASALFEKAAWVRLLGGLGGLTEVGLAVLLAVLFLRWRNRRSASRRHKHNASTP